MCPEELFYCFFLKNLKQIFTKILSNFFGWVVRNTFYVTKRSLWETSGKKLKFYIVSFQTLSKKKFSDFGQKISLGLSKLHSAGPGKHLAEDKF